MELRTNSGRRPHRLASVIVKAAKNPVVVRTIDEWGHEVGVAAGTLRTWCSAADLHPRAAVAFTRALGALHNAHTSGLNPEDLLDFADKRAMNRFLLESGRLTSSGGRTSVKDFCNQQQFLKHARILSDVLELMAF
jgi:hypothetical protein